MIKPKTKILIIDDDARNRRILNEILEEDYLVKEADSGDNALYMLKNYKPDIILLDIMMPGIDGFETCKRIRQSSVHKFTKIILVSGKVQLDDRLKGYESGADDYITKPFDEDELLAKLQVFERLHAIEEIDAFKTRFLSVITEETGTPLSTIISLSSFLQSQDNISDDDKEILTNINHAAEALADKISKVLLFSTLSNPQDLDISPINLAEILDEAESRLRHFLDEKQLTLKISESHNCKTLGVGELLINTMCFILENIITYTSRSVIIKINITSFEDHCLITFAYPGTGTSMNNKSSFYDLAFNNKSNVPLSVCINLALVQRILELHNGELMINQDDQITTYQITIPTTL